MCKPQKGVWVFLKHLRPPSPSQVLLREAFLDCLPLPSFASLQDPLAVTSLSPPISCCPREFVRESPSQGPLLPSQGAPWYRSHPGPSGHRCSQPSPFSAAQRAWSITGDWPKKQGRPGGPRPHGAETSFCTSNTPTHLIGSEDRKGRGALASPGS